LEAMKLPVVSQFIRSDVEKIISLQPDLVLGFSDLQKDIASVLIGRGLNVFVTNQRSIEEILNYILTLGRLVDRQEKALELVQSFEIKLEHIKQKAANLSKRPRVYFEEWDSPRISAISWVSELIEICGGENIFKHKSGSLAKERFVKDEEIIELNPEIIFGCWCGKPFKPEKVKMRAGYEGIQSIKTNNIVELPPEIFLQPGPALFVDGIDQLFAYFQSFVDS